MKKILLTIVMLIAALPLWAHDFEVDGIYYNITDADALTIEVTYQGSSYSEYSDEYSGEIDIPRGIEYSGKIYTVVSIGEAAFCDCSITKVTIPTTVSEIGNFAFSITEGLTSITIPESVVTIGECAFNQAGLVSIDIPNSVKTIEEGAFAGCTSLLEVTIPQSVTYIGLDAFEFCTSLTTVNYNAEDCYISYSNGQTVNPIFYGCASLVNLNIGNTVKEIPSYSFMSLEKITSVAIPESVTYIGRSAFKDCTKLTEVNISDINAWYNIHFYDAESNPLNNSAALKLDDAVIYDLVIPENITTIKNYAFHGCSSLASIIIPKSVTTIGENTFSNCSELKDITFENSVIGAYMFSGCTGLTSLTIPQTITSIDQYAFKNCTNLTEINISNLTSWCNIDFATYESNPLCSGASLMLNGSEVTDLTIPDDVTEIKSLAFYGCKNLKSLNISETTTTIGGSAFYGCTGLTTITVSESVESIGSAAFYGCTGLTTITVPESVESIGNSAFSGCSNLKEVCISNLSAWCKIKFGLDSNPMCNGAILNLNGILINELVIPEDITTIQNRTFYGCSSITSVSIHDSVTSIGYSAFDNCTSLAEITCKAVTPPAVSSNFPNYDATLNVLAESIEAYKAADYWKKFTNIIGFVENGAKFVVDGITYKKIAENEAEVTYGETKYSGDITIPASVNYANTDFKVLALADSAFFECGDLTSIALPDGLTKIGKRALSFTGIKEIIVPNTVTSIVGAAFANCFYLKDVTLSENITVLTMNLFNNCTALEEITIPYGVTRVNENCFLNCTKLAEIDLPESVTVIEAKAFKGCTALSSVYLPSSLTHIKLDAFAGCENLSYIKSKAVVPPAVSSDFPNYEATLVVPDESVEAYKAADYWKNFTNVFATSGAELIGVDGEPTIEVVNGEIVINGGAVVQIAVYAINGVMLYEGANRPVAATKGIYIVLVNGKATKVII